MKYHIAEINIARMKGVDINDPIMKEFVENLDAVNQIAESSEGFVWRLKDDTNNATSLNPYDDEQVIINVSVWQSIESLENFMYKTFHSEFLKRRKEWFVAYGTAHTAMWWVPAGHIPSTDEAEHKVQELRLLGPAPSAFNLRTMFSPTGEQIS